MKKKDKKNSKDSKRNLFLKIAQEDFSFNLVDAALEKYHTAVQRKEENERRNVQE